MLRDRYEPVDLLAQLPVDNLRFDPVLAALDRLLDDDPLFQAVKADLSRRRPHTRTRGRYSTPVEVILRMLVVMRLYRWSYAETEHWVRDSLTLRQFCRVYWESVPDDTVLIRWANCIGPATVAQLHERVVALAQQQQVTRGRKLRVDATVVETHIHHPCDSRLLGDGVRVLARGLRRAQKLADTVPALAALGKQVFQGHTRTCRKLAQEFHRLARKKGKAAVAGLRQAYERQLAVTRKTVRQAQRVVQALQERATAAATRVREQLEHYLPLVQKGIQQAERRVLHGEAVPAPEKLLSLFEPHTQIITRHKAGKQVEFGRKVWLEEVEGGIVSGYRVLEAGGGTEQPYLAATLAAHQERFGHVPDLLAGDRGVSSADNEALATAAGVKHVVLPYSGKAPPERRQRERTAWFRRGFRFRAGIEGRIHVLKRDYGLDCCRYHGAAGLERWVGWGILTHNLAQIARHEVAQQAK